MPNFVDDPTKPKKPQASPPGPGGPELYAQLPGTMVNSTAPPPLGNPNDPAPPTGIVPGPQPPPLGNPNDPAPPTAIVPGPQPPPLGNPNDPAPPTAIVPPAAPKRTYSTTGQFGSTGMTEAEWRARYPEPGYDGAGNPVGGSAAPAAPPAPGAPAPAPPSPAAPVPGGPASPAGPPATVNDAYKKALMDGLTRTPTTSLDQRPELRGQADAYAVQQERAKNRARENMAGRAAATGQLSDRASSGAFESGLSGLEQAQGEAQGAFNANLLATNAQQERDDLLRYAALAGQDLNAEEARDLQERITNLNADIERSRIAQTGQLGGQDLDLRRYGIDTQGKLGEGDLNLRLMLGLLGNQFNQDRLGADVGMWNQSRNDDAFWRMLGGL